jgi:hypothetical protein
MQRSDRVLIDGRFNGPDEPLLVQQELAANSTPLRCRLQWYVFFQIGTTCLISLRGRVGASLVKSEDDQKVVVSRDMVPT